MLERLFDAESGRLPAVLIPLAEAYAATGESSEAYSSYSRAVTLLEQAGESTDEHLVRLKELQESADGYSAESD